MPSLSNCYALSLLIISFLKDYLLLPPYSYFGLKCKWTMSVVLSSPVKPETDLLQIKVNKSPDTV